MWERTYNEGDFHIVYKLEKSEFIEKMTTVLKSKHDSDYVAEENAGTQREKSSPLIGRRRRGVGSLQMATPRNQFTRKRRLFYFVSVNTENLRWLVSTSFRLCGLLSGPSSRHTRVQ
jgi:hypothetical protein